MKRLLMLALWLGPNLAAASVVIGATERELALQADAIVVGTIIRTQTLTQTGGQILTHGTMQVYESLGGARPGEILTVQVSGGKPGGPLVAEVAGAPRLEPGQLWLAFLQRWPDGTLRPLGMRYGMLPVTRGDDGVYRVSRDTTGLFVMDRHGQPVAESVYRIADVPLDDLWSRLRVHLGARPDGPIDQGTWGGPGGVTP